MKFNSNQKYTRWSIRRLSVGVASVVVASGFFLLVGQPNTVHADVLTTTPTEVLQTDSSSLEKNELPETVLKEGVDSALPENQSAPKEVVDETNPSDKSSLASKEEVAKPKEEEAMSEVNEPKEEKVMSEVNKPKEEKVMSEVNKPKEEEAKPVATPDVVSNQAREAAISQSVTTPDEVKKGVEENTKDSVDVPASYLEKANVPGPFLAGVNQVIPYEAFGGDGMLTRLLLKSSDKAPWSDNGTANNPALLPLEGLAKGQYFYEVDLNGNTTGKDGQALLDQLRANGTYDYQATVKVYGAKDGKADLTNLVATKNVTVNLNGLVSKEAVKDSVTKNIKDHIDVPASYLEKANVPGPFLAGVNQVIPYEAFGGDGMLTRLLLKSSDKAPWSDNGTAKNPALLPLEGLAKGQYFYEVDLNGNTTGKDGQALLDQLRANGTHTYQATVKVYGAKDGKADLSNLVATKNVTVDMNGLISKEAVKDSVTKNIKDHIDVPASYLEKANVPGPFLAGVNQVIPYEAFGGDGMLTRLLLKSSDQAPWSDNGTAKNPALLPLEGLAKGQYFYEVDLNGNTTGKDGQALLDQLRANGTHTYQATVKVYGAKDGKTDLTNLVATKNVTVNLNGLVSKEAVKDSVTKNIKDHIDVPASYLEKANVPGPFLAGVNQVIPYEAFGGDGMLTRLLLKSSDQAPWSDNGTANNPALLPLEGLAKGQYFYEVDLNGNTTGKDGQALLDQLRANGTHTYQATVKVYGAKDGKADLSNLVATKNVTVDMNGLVSKEAIKDSVTKNIKDHIDVPASYLEKANVPGPFLAGVNQVIPYEAFGGDGMLTRLLLKSSDKAPWSDNGTANNPALLPLEGLAKGQYFYEVDLNGNTTGKDGQALLDQLRANGTHTYQATVKVYGAKDGKADLSNLVATKNVTVDMNGLISKEAVKDSVTKNIKDHIDVPASYLEKANVPGPFLAGVNQVIPYEAFGGDGMLTRLLLKSSDKAPWSDNGTANNPALLPLEGLAKGQYFYEVDLNGNTTGKDGQALLDQLRANGTYAYQATVKVYGAKDGKPDLTNLIATRQVTIQLRGKEMATIPSQEGQMNMKPSTTPSQEGQMNKKPSATDSMSTAEGTKEVDHRMTDVKGEQPTSKPMADTMKKNDKLTLPKTGEAQTATATIGFLGLVLAGILSLLGLKEKQKD